MYILHRGTVFKKEFSVALNDGDADQYVSELLQDNPRRLHEMVAHNHVVGTRVSHLVRWPSQFDFWSKERFAPLMDL